MGEKSYPLFEAEPSLTWHRRPQQTVAAWARAKAMPILPVYSLTERGPDIAPDWEEQQAGPLLAGGLRRLPDTVLFPVLPPLRHLPAQWEGQLFTLLPQEAWRILEELVASVAQSGFQRLLVVHAHPLLADWLDCGLRDARIATDMSLYRLSLDAAGFICDPSAPNVRAESEERLAGLLHEVYRHGGEEVTS